MADRVITADQLTFNKAGRPVHCGHQMEYDHEFYSCPDCDGYVKTSSVIDRRNQLGIKTAF